MCKLQTTRRIEFDTERTTTFVAIKIYAGKSNCNTIQLTSTNRGASSLSYYITAAADRFIDRCRARCTFSRRSNVVTVAGATAAVSAAYILLVHLDCRQCRRVRPACTFGGYWI